MSTQTANPFDILQQRRKLKHWKKNGAVECMKILKRVRQMNLTNKMLIATELPRTLIYVANRTRESENEDVKKMNKMCRYLAKEWRKQLGVEDKKEKKDENKQEKKDENKEKPEPKQNGNKIEQEKHE